MSELGTVPRKSLVARFNEEKIIRIATSPDDPTRLWITVLDDGKEKTFPLSLDGDVDIPKTHVEVTNDSSVNTTFNNMYAAGSYGAVMSPGVDSGETVTIDALFTTYSDGINEYAACNISNSDGLTVTVNETVNCHYATTNVYAVDDPSQDAYIKLTLSN